MLDGEARTTRAPNRSPRLGESHRVEIADAVVIERDLIVTFRDLDRPHRAYVESYHISEVSDLSLGDRGFLTRERSRVHRDRWFFHPEGQGVSDGG